MNVNFILPMSIIKTIDALTFDKKNFLRKWDDNLKISSNSFLMDEILFNKISNIKKYFPTF